MAFDPRTGLMTATKPVTGAGGPVPTTPGAAPTGYNPAYGGVPQVPNLIDIYGTATGANKAMLPGFIDIGGTVTGANEEELLRNLGTALPGYDASVAQSMSNIGSLQRGQIPEDVLNLLKQQGAERGVATGYYDSPNANAALLRSMGLTSLGLQGEGEKQMSALVGRTPQVQPFDVSKLMMSPTDLYESNLLANMYRAAPVPQAAAQQLISDQMAGYNTGRGNVPSFAPAGSSGGGLAPLSRTPWSADRPNPPGVGALGPFPAAPAPYTPITGNLQAGGGSTAGMEWDPEMGTYYNRFTGQYVPPEEGSPGWITWGGAQSDTPIDFSDVTGPTYDTGEYYGD